MGVVQEARAQWEDGLNKELQEIARERAEPLARPRPPGEHENGDADNGNSRVSPQVIGWAQSVEHIGARGRADLIVPPAGWLQLVMWTAS